MSVPSALVVIGGGEHARVVIEAARSRPDLWKVIGFADLQPCPETSERFHLPFLGCDEEGLRRAATSQFVLAIGGSAHSPLRRKLAERYARGGACWATVIHARASISPTATLGHGVVVLAGATINTGAVIGDHSLVNTGALIEHDVQLGAFTQVGPMAAIGGGTALADDCYLGLGSIVRDHVRLGRGVTVAMGAVVVRDVPADQVVAGVPAKPLRGSRLDH